MAAARSPFLHPILLLPLLLLSAEPSTSHTTHSPPPSPLHSPHPSPESSPLPSPPSSTPEPSAPPPASFHSLPAPPGPSPSLTFPSPTPSPTPTPSPSPAPSFAGIHAADSNDVEGGSPSSENGGLSGGQKAGIGLGVVLGATVVGVGAVVYKKRQENISRSRYGYATRRDML